MNIGDSLWIVVFDGPNGIAVTPHVERETAWQEVNDNIDRMLRGRGVKFRDPGTGDPEARLDAWNEYERMTASDPFCLHVEEEPLVR